MNNKENDNINKLTLNLPSMPLNIKEGDKKGELKIFDTIRRKYVALTPEEYVRVHFVNWLTRHLRYPVSHIGNEIGITLNNTSRRCDTIVYGDMGEPLMIVEYKAPYITIDQNVFDQIVRYNMVLRAKYLVVSNGLKHYCCVIDYANNNYYFLPQVPTYDALNSVFNNALNNTLNNAHLN
jgi:hypothetical protein